MIGKISIRPEEMLLLVLKKSVTNNIVECSTVEQENTRNRWVTHKMSLQSLFLLLLLLLLLSETTLNCIVAAWTTTQRTTTITQPRARQMLQRQRRPLPCSPPQQEQESISDTSTTTPTTTMIPSSSLSLQAYVEQIRMEMGDIIMNTNTNEGRFCIGEPSVDPSKLWNPNQGDSEWMDDW